MGRPYSDTDSKSDADADGYTYIHAATNTFSPEHAATENSSYSFTEAQSLIPE